MVSMLDKRISSILLDFVKETNSLSNEMNMSKYRLELNSLIERYTATIQDLETKLPVEDGLVDAVENGRWTL